MGVGNYLGIRSDERVREAQRLPEHEAFPIRHGLATFLAFVAAGAVPLLPYVFSGMTANLFATSTGLSLAVLFVVGAARARVGTGSWWANGLENARSRRHRRRGGVLRRRYRFRPYRESVS
jgi:VIT1/CCC1 family predicted Fe2+/Mn2+ transporter